MCSRTGHAYYHVREERITHATRRRVKVVVTGGAGFIGANLVQRLVKEPSVDGIVVLDDLSSGLKTNLDSTGDIEFRPGTILDPGLLDEVCTGADAIVHLAARPSVPRSIEDPVASHEANASGTVQVIEAARRAGNAHVVVASSSSVYGSNPTLPKSEDMRPIPMSPYAVSKLATESYALSHSHCYDLPVLAFRLFNVFGPLQAAGHAYAAVIPALVSAAVEGRPLPIHGNGEQTRDFTFVGSVAEVITRAVTEGTTSSDPVNLAFGSRRSLLDVVTELDDLLGGDLEVENLPGRTGDVRHSQADSTRLRLLFPGAVPVPFREGLRQTVCWFRSLAN